MRSRCGGVRHEKVDKNPAVGVKRLREHNIRDRVLANEALTAPLKDAMSSPMRCATGHVFHRNEDDANYGA